MGGASLLHTHVETVCLLSKLHEAKHHVNVKLDMDEMDLTATVSKEERGRDCGRIKVFSDDIK